MSFDSSFLYPKFVDEYDRVCRSMSEHVGICWSMSEHVGMKVEHYHLYLALTQITSKNSLSINISGILAGDSVLTACIEDPM